MAISSIEMKPIQRSKNGNAVAFAAYCSGQKFLDENTGISYDFTKKTDVVFSCVLAPTGSPTWCTDSSQLWNQAERVEKRVDAQLAREVRIALPIELNLAQQKKLLADYIQESFVQQGMIADYHIHYDKPEGKPDGKPGNPHVHILLTMRTIEPAGFGLKNRAWNQKGFLRNVRLQWANFANKALEEAGSDQRIDHRTLEEQLKERLGDLYKEVSIKPTIHLGVATFKALSRGKKTKRLERQIEILEDNISSLSTFFARRKTLILSDEAEVSKIDFLKELLLKNKKSLEIILKLIETKSHQFLSSDEKTSHVKSLKESLSSSALFFKAKSKNEQNDESNFIDNMEMPTLSKLNNSRSR